MGRWTRGLAINLSTTRELIAFVWSEPWRLTPIIVVLLFLTAIVLFLEGSAMARVYLRALLAEMCRGFRGSPVYLQTISSDRCRWQALHNT
jgi:hypothetical protein